jgi:hypothetical protein
MRILIAANPLKPKKFESVIFWGLGIDIFYFKMFKKLSFLTEGLKRKNGEQKSAAYFDVYEGIWGKSQISPKSHEDSSIEAMNKFAEEIELYPNPKKLRIQTSWVSKDWQQFKSAFFGDLV